MFFFLFLYLYFFNSGSIVRYSAPLVVLGGYQSLLKLQFPSSSTEGKGESASLYLKKKKKKKESSGVESLK